MPVKQPRKKAPAATRTVLRAGSYGRTSGDEQEAAGTIETQLHKNRQYCVVQEWQLVQEYRDDGWSGYTYRMEEREDGKRLVAAIEAGELDLVVVFALDRIGRRLLFCAEFIEFCKRHGVGVVSVTQGVNTLDPIGEMIASILIAFAQWERGAIVARTSAGRDRVLEAPEGCRWLSGPVPPGFTLERRQIPGKKAEAPYLVVDPAQAPVWETVFGNIDAGSSAVAELKRLVAEGISADVRYAHATRPAKWNPSRFLKLLHNPVYKGTHEATRSDGSIQERACEAIVPAAVWERVQVRLGENRRLAKRGHKHAYLLSGLLACAHCRAAYVGFTNRGARAYRCNAVCGPAALRGEPRARCPGAQVPAWKVEAAVWGWARGVVLRPGDAIAEARAQLRAQQERAASSGPEQAALTSRVRELEREQAHVREMTRRRLYTLDEGEAELAALEEQAGAVRGRLAALRVAGQLAAEAVAEFTDLATSLEGVRRGLAVIERDEAKRAGLLRRLVARITVETRGRGEAPALRVYPRLGSEVDLTTRHGGGVYFALTPAAA